MAVSDPCPKCDGAGQVFRSYLDKYIECLHCLGCGVIVGKDADDMVLGQSAFTYKKGHDTIWKSIVSKLLRQHPEWFPFPTSVIPDFRDLDQIDDDDNWSPYGRI